MAGEKTGSTGTTPPGRPAVDGRTIYDSALTHDYAEPDPPSTAPGSNDKPLGSRDSGATFQPWTVWIVD